jgi:hypothetical protein
MVLRFRGMCCFLLLKKRKGDQNQNQLLTGADLKKHVYIIPKSHFNCKLKVLSIWTEYLLEKSLLYKLLGKIESYSGIYSATGYVAAIYPVDIEKEARGLILVL